MFNQFAAIAISIAVLFSASTQPDITKDAIPKKEPAPKSCTGVIEASNYCTSASITSISMTDNLGTTLYVHPVPPGFTHELICGTIGPASFQVNLTRRAGHFGCVKLIQSFTGEELDSQPWSISTPSVTVSGLINCAHYEIVITENGCL